MIIYMTINNDETIELDMPNESCIPRSGETIITGDVIYHVFNVTHQKVQNEWIVFLDVDLK